MNRLEYKKKVFMVLTSEGISYRYDIGLELKIKKQIYEKLNKGTIFNYHK
jgi:hypothetical protein